MLIKFEGIQTPTFCFDKPGNQPVTCISTFPYRPMQLQTYHEIWLDANILSQALAGRPNPNILSLVNVALENRFAINPMLALAEYNRGNDAMTAMEMMLARVPRMEEVYGFEFDMLAVTAQSAQLQIALDKDRQYIKSLSDLMIVIKYFFAKKNWGFKRRFETFARIVRAHLPSFVIVSYVACLYFFAKERRDLFESSFGKMQGDMYIHTDPAENRKNADNLASDLAIFTQTTAYPVTKNPVLFRIPYIATSDEGLALLLREIAYFRIYLEKGTGFGYPGFRQGGVMASHCPEVADVIVEKYLTDVPQEQIRMDKLDRIAEEILEGTFDHERYLDK